MADPVYLDDLEDVEVPDPTDGDVLYWDEAASLWKCKAFVPVFDSLEKPIIASSDDCRVVWNGAAWAISLTIVNWSSGYWKSTDCRQGGGGCYQNITIPPGALITNAYLKVTASYSCSGTVVRSRIHGEKNINPATFSTLEDYQGRARTDAVIDWDNIPAWIQNAVYHSPNIKSIIQEIVNLPGWSSGNPIVIFWDDHEDRTSHIDSTARGGHAWDSNPEKTVTLRVEWITW